MSKQPEQLEPKFESLLLTKSYEQLNVAEKEYAYAQLSAQAPFRSGVGEVYQTFRQILLAAPELESPTPDPALRDTLLQQFRQSRRQPNPGFLDKLRQALQHPIPSWQVGLACILLSFSTYFFATQKNSTKHVNANIEETGKVVLTSRSAKEEKELLVLLTGVK